jgi:hypothetical protein
VYVAESPRSEQAALIQEAPMRNRGKAALAAIALACASPLAVAAASSGPAATAAAPPATAAAIRPQVTPLPAASHFQRHVTNRYFPLSPGMRWVYRGFGSEGGDRDVVTVLGRTKPIAGIRATVVRDVVHNHGRLIERTFDWYGQDDRGRVWYLGENTKAYEGGHVSTTGSWETGVHGARPGVIMFKHPRLEVRYWQEFLRGQAEDQGQVLDLATRVGVPAGHFRHARMTEDTSPIEPHVVEFKFYAPGVGVVAEIDASPAPGRVALIKFTK